jgi:hypothetical protein
VVVVQVNIRSALNVHSGNQRSGSAAHAAGGGPFQCPALSLVLGRRPASLRPSSLRRLRMSAGWSAGRACGARTQAWPGGRDGH